MKEVLSCDIFVHQLAFNWTYQKWLAAWERNIIQIWDEKYC